MYESIDVQDKINRALSQNRTKGPFHPVRCYASGIGCPASQVTENPIKNGGADLGMSEKILHRARLSRQIYKICTLLSTDIVEKLIGRGSAPPRKALLDAAREGYAPHLGHGGR